MAVCGAIEPTRRKQSGPRGEVSRMCNTSPQDVLQLESHVINLMHWRGIGTGVPRVPGADLAPHLHYKHGIVKRNIG